MNVCFLIVLIICLPVAELQDFRVGALSVISGLLGLGFEGLGFRGLGLCP